MCILFFLFLTTSCLIYSGHATDNPNQIEKGFIDHHMLGNATTRQKRGIVGGETEQDPNDPKYQKMAEELVRDNLRIKREDIIQSIKVNRVTTKVVSGVVTTLVIKITLANGIPDQCRFEVWEQPWIDVKHVSYVCGSQRSKKTLSGDSGTPRPEQIRDPKNPKYLKLAKASINYLSDTAKDTPFKKEDVNDIYVTNVKAQIGSKITNHIQFNVVTINKENYQCVSVILEKPWNVDESVKASRVKCTLTNRNKLLLNGSPNKFRNTPSNETEDDPDKPIYRNMAKVSFEQFMRTHHFTVQVKNYKMKKVTTQSFIGKTTQIDFDVITVFSQSFPCHSKIYEGPVENRRDITVDCKIHIIKHRLGGQTNENPNDPRYMDLAKQSFQKYLQSHWEDDVHVKTIKVDTVTSQVVAGRVIRIHFKAYPTLGRTFYCQSEIFEGLGRRRQLDFKVNCDHVPGDQVEEDPSDPQFQQLAKESFEKYSETHVVEIAQELKVTRATTQLVNGKLIRLDFDAIMAIGGIYKCHSKVLINFLNNKKTYAVECSTDNYAPSTLKQRLKLQKKSGNETEDDPDKPIYRNMAKVSFEQFMRTHHFTIQVKNYKMKKVTTQSFIGKTTQIDFDVITVFSQSFPCHSKIYEGPVENRRDITVDCKIHIIKHRQGGQTNENPNDPRYMDLAKQSFQKYLQSHWEDDVHVKTIKVDTVTSQVVAGRVIRIHFKAYPTLGRTFYCQSEIFEGLGRRRQLNFKVNCDHVPGDQVEEDPSDPQFQQLAKESFEKYSETHVVEIAQELKVTRATTQLVNGKVIRLDFDAIMAIGGIYKCHSKVLINFLNNKKTYAVECSTDNYAPSTHIQSRKSNKRVDIAREAVRAYLMKQYHNEIGFDSIKTKNIRKVRTRVSKQRITYYKVDASIHNMEGDHFKYECSVVTGSWFGRQPISTNCIEQNSLDGGNWWNDPTKKQFLSFAEQALKKYLKNPGEFEENILPRDYKKYDVIVTFVQSAVVAGQSDDINFVARWVHGDDSDPLVLLCNTNIWEKVDRKRSIEILKVNCEIISWDRNRVRR